MRQLFIIQSLMLLLCINIIAQKTPDAPLGSRVFLGNEILFSDSLAQITNKNIGVVTNHTGRLPNGLHLIDTLSNTPSIRLTALFAPEHGIRGDAPAGDEIADGNDLKTGLPVFSLHGKTRKPTPEMLKNVDIILFDIQDVGARFYTYIWTLYNVMESAIENSKKVVVLDRPNPINGLDVEGPVIDQKYFSFLGNAAIPIQHGMTIGELSLFFNDILQKKYNKKCDLKVIKMKNWSRELYYDECNIPWRATSPNMPNLETAIVYPGMCLFEATNVSEGRGTDSPFLNIGAPWLNSDRVIEEFNKLNVEGVSLFISSFTPKNIKSKAYNPKYKDEKCYGILISVTDRKSINAIDLGIGLLYSIAKIHPNKFEIISANMNRLFGQPYLTEMLKTGKTPYQIRQKWKDDLQFFLKIRKRYLLY